MKICVRCLHQGHLSHECPIPLPLPLAPLNCAGVCRTGQACPHPAQCAEPAWMRSQEPPTGEDGPLLVSF